MMIIVRKQVDIQKNNELQIGDLPRNVWRKRKVSTGR